VVQNQYYTPHVCFLANKARSRCSIISVCVKCVTNMMPCHESGMGSLYPFTSILELLSHTC